MWSHTLVKTHINSVAQLGLVRRNDWGNHLGCNMGRRQSALSLSRSNVILLLAFGLPATMSKPQQTMLRMELCQYMGWNVQSSFFHWFSDSSCTNSLFTLFLGLARISLCDAVVKLTPPDSPQDQRVSCSVLCWWKSCWRKKHISSNLDVSQDLWCVDMFSGKRAIYNFWRWGLKETLCAVNLMCNCHPMCVDHVAVIMSYILCHEQTGKKGYKASRAQHTFYGKHVSVCTAGSKSITHLDTTRIGGWGNISTWRMVLSMTFQMRTDFGSEIQIQKLRWIQSLALFG